MTKNQKIALGLVGGAFIALLFCAFTKEWFVIARGSDKGKVGLRSVTECYDGNCKTQSLDEVFGSYRKTDDATDTWMTASKITFLGALASAAGLLLVGVFGFMRHPKVGLAGKIVLLILIGTILAAVFVLAKKPPISGLNASWGVFLFMGGGMAGVIGAYMLGNPSTYEEIERDPSIPKL